MPVDDMRAISEAIERQGPRGAMQGSPMPTEEKLRKLLATGQITPEQYAQATGREPQGPPQPIPVGSGKYMRDFFNPFSSPPPGGYVLPKTR